MIGDLERYFSDVTTFGFSLAGVSEFPGGPTYLAPEPAAVFRRLTVGLLRVFPEFPPYGGAFDDVVPHLSVPLLDGEDTETLRAELHRRLPIEAVAHTRRPGAGGRGRHPDAGDVPVRDHRRLIPSECAG